MSAQLVLELVAELPQLEPLNDAIDAFAEAQAWSPEALFQVKLAVEEVVVNVMSYGGEGGRVPLIRFSLVQHEGQVSIEIADNGVAFDPLDRPPPDLESSLEDRAVGGLGVFLVRQMMDSVSYRRDDGWNRLALAKALG